MLSNLYLNELDHLMEAEGYAMTRYADDMVILCRSREEAEKALESVRAWMNAAHLTLHPGKTRVVDMSELQAHFDFLGYLTSSATASSAVGGGDCCDWPVRKAPQS